MTHFVFLVALILIVTAFELTVIPTALLGFFCGALAVYTSVSIMNFMKETNNEVING